MQQLMVIGGYALVAAALAGCASFPAGRCHCAPVATAPTAPPTATAKTETLAATPAPQPVAKTAATSATAPTTDLQAWLTFATAANALTPAELASQRRRAGERFKEAASADNRLRLAYLLSRPAPTGQNLDRSRELLAALPAQHRYAALRDLILRELDLTVNLSGARNKVRAQQAQLEALKAIEADLTENQKELEQLAR